MSMMVSFCAVLDEILDLIKSVSEDFLTYSYTAIAAHPADHQVLPQHMCLRPRYDNLNNLHTVCLL